MKKTIKKCVGLFAIIMLVILSITLSNIKITFADDTNEQTLTFTEWMLETQVPNGVNLEDPKYEVNRKVARYAHKQGDWQIDAVLDGDYTTKEAYMCWAYTDETRVKYTTEYGFADCFDLLRVYLEKDVYEVYGECGTFYLPPTIKKGETSELGEIYAIYLEGESLSEYVSQRGPARGETEDYTLMWSFESDNGGGLVKIPVYCAVDKWVYVDEMSDIPGGDDVIVEEGPFVSYAIKPVEYDESGSWSAWMKISDLPEKVKNNPNGFDIETATSRYKATVKTDWTINYPIVGDYISKTVYVSYAWVDDKHTYYYGDVYNEKTTNYNTKIRIYSEYPINGGALTNTVYAKEIIEDRNLPYEMPMFNEFPYALPKSIKTNTIIPGIGYIYLITENKTEEVAIDKFEGAIGDNVTSPVSSFFAVSGSFGPNTCNVFCQSYTPNEWTYTAREVTASDTMEVEKDEYVRYRVKLNSTDWSDWCLEGDLPDVVVSNPDKYTVETASYRYKNVNDQFEYTDVLPETEYEEGPYYRYISNEINYGAVLELKGAVVKAGEEFKLTLELKNNMTIERLKISAIDYDKNVFELVKVENGDMFEDMDDSDAPNCLWKNAKSSTTGTVATYTFKVKDDAIINNSTKYTFEYSLISAMDGKSETVELNVENATVLLDGGVSNTGSVLSNGSLVVIVGILCFALGVVGTLLVITIKKKNVTANNGSDEE